MARSAIQVRSAGQGRAPSLRAARILALSVLGMEALCLAAWLRWLAVMRPALDPINTPALLSLAVGTWAAAWWLGKAVDHLPRTRVLALLAAAGSVLMLDGLRYGWAGWPLALPRALLSHPLPSSGRVLTTWLLLWLWWRALVHAQVPLTGERVRGLVARAVAVVAVLGLVAALTRPVAMGGFVYGAAVCGLLALAGAALRDTRRGLASGMAVVGATWLTTVTVWSLGVTAFAAGLTALFWQGLGAELLAASHALWDRVETLVIAAAILLGRVGGWVAEAVARFLGPDFALKLMEMVRGLQRMLPAPSVAREDPAMVAQEIAWLVGALRLLLLLGLLALVTALLIRAMRPEGNDADTDTVLGEAEGGLSLRHLSADLRDLLARLAADARAALRWGGAGRQGVRALYGRLLALLASRGTVRAPATTPDAFLPAAAAALPAAGASIAALTAAYERVRYGDITPDEAEWEGLRADWERIRDAAHPSGGASVRPGS